MFYAGIDIAKRNHEASVIDASGQSLMDSLSFPNSQAGCEKFCQLLERLNIPQHDLIIGMEATGHYWLAIYAYLTENGYTVHVINPIQSDAFRRMSIRQTKTDAIDALLIAQVIRFGQYSTTTLSEENIIALRQLSRYRLALVDICGDSKRRVIALLDQVFPEYERLFCDMFGTSSRELLLRCQTPEDMLAISSEELTVLLSKASRGRFTQGKALEIQQAASSTFGISYAKDAFAFQIKQLIEQICFSETTRSLPPSPAWEKHLARSFSRRSVTSIVLIHLQNWLLLQGWMFGSINPVSSLVRGTRSPSVVPLIFVVPSGWPPPVPLFVIPLCQPITNP